MHGAIVMSAAHVGHRCGPAPRVIARVCLWAAWYADRCARQPSHRSVAFVAGAAQSMHSPARWARSRRSRLYRALRVGDGIAAWRSPSTSVAFRVRLAAGGDAGAGAVGGPHVADQAGDLVIGEAARV